ncbi:MAG: hypothetical protein Q7S12_01390 [bacterium]|nr:hypothetical protein [bacterium]
MKTILKIGLFLSIFATLFGASHVFAASPTITRFDVTPASVNLGGSVTISWASQNSSGCSLSGGPQGFRGQSDTFSYTPYKAGAYTIVITCTFAGESSDQQSRTIAVYDANSTNNGNTSYNPQPQPAYSGIPTINLYSNKSVITAGEQINLSWSTSNAGSCYGTGGFSGYKNINGSETTYPANNTTYTITCSNGYGANSSNLTIYVNRPASQPTPTPFSQVVATPTPKPTPTPVTQSKPAGGTGKVEGASTICKQVTVCFDQGTGKTTETPISPPMPSSAGAAPSPSVSKNNSKSASPALLASIFNIKGDVGGKIKSLAIWYVVILLAILLVVLSYMGIKRMKIKKEAAEPDQQNRNE